jgi:hypothetical protein
VRGSHNSFGVICATPAQAETVVYGSITDHCPYHVRRRWNPALAGVAREPAKAVPAAVRSAVDIPGNLSAGFPNLRGLAARWWSSAYACTSSDIGPSAARALAVASASSSARRWRLKSSNYSFVLSFHAAISAPLWPKGRILPMVVASTA